MTTHRKPGHSLATAGLIFVLVLTGCGRGGQGTTSSPQGGMPQISDRGPGLRPQPLSALQLPVPRTVELTHVDPKHFAAALEQDPERLFDFVRDQIGYEAYQGSLRGARGTLLAMAGNSVDRAILLASLFQAAGRTVRFARGTLSERDSRDLVGSMWAKAPKPASPQTAPASSAVKTAVQTFTNSLTRDTDIIGSRLKDTTLTSRPSGLEDLIAGARAHYWIQWARNGQWIDLDPSFADALPGRRYAQVDQTFDSLPESLFHRATIRIRLEEYSDGSPSSREILTVTTKASDLSGIDLILLHVPENWKGPASGLGQAISTAIEDTGRIKPVLLGRPEPIIGEPFRPRLTTTGIGGIGPLLSGEGSRNAAILATAEWIEFEFDGPGNRREAIAREIFDVIGKARRASGQTLTKNEAQTLTEGAKAFDLTQAIYSLFFTTGQLNMRHLSHIVQTPVPREQDTPEIGSLLRRISISFAAISDSLIRTLEKPGQVVVRFYPDSPRVFIAEASAPAGVPRLSFDLRRDHTRAVALGKYPGAEAAARIFRGVVNDTLERVLLEYVTSAAREKGEWGPVMSTSSLLEQAQVERVPVILLPRDDGRLDSQIPLDVLARLREETSQGYLAVAPQRPILVAGSPRFAWWRIHPQSGETTAVTDEGLHQTTSERVYAVERQDGSVGIYRSVGGRYRLVAEFADDLAVLLSEFGTMNLIWGISLPCGGRCRTAPR